ncbi:MmgE/PrpD family protein [Pseudoruegeria sp. HB172150]|uniref:MmgE/PrpD family protein n=1 Tax=Pseudoruegeria sp. HB172150 TaxID=2721164 RepID=UPI001C12DBF8|nr:MmgE/PrpD family protein [Pseudoruegeria sp. HB172150]
MVTETLAKFAVAALPSEGARAMMRLSLFDWAVCGIAGRNEPVSRIVREMVRAEAGAPQSTLFCDSTRAPARAAALSNGATSHALDFDDTHFGPIAHPSVAIIPAALAVAEREGADGGRFLDACLIGAEVAIRLGEWLGRSHYDAGFHMTATAGTFGATAAVGRILKLDAHRMAHALSIAATRASGLKSQFGTMGKPYHAGLAAAAGVEAATLGAAGIISRPDGIECAQGFADTHAAERNADAFDELGEDWRFDHITHKFHACCHGTHATVEALTGMAPRLAGQTIDTVTLRVHPSWLKVCNIETPETGLAAKFSLRLCAAMALDGQETADLATFSDEACKRPRLIELRDKVRVEGDDSLSVSATHVAVSVASGSTFEAVHDLQTPLPMPDRATKLRGKARALLGDPIFGPIWKTITTQEKPHLPAFIRCVGGQFPAQVAASG